MKQKANGISFGELVDGWQGRRAGVTEIGSEVRARLVEFRQIALGRQCTVTGSPTLPRLRSRPVALG